MNKMVLTKT